MIEGNVSFPVKRPPAEVFQRLTDPEAALRLAPDAARVRNLSGGEVRLGSQYELEVKAMGRSEKGTLEVVELEEGRTIAYAAASGPGQVHVRFEVEPDGEGSRVACRYSLKLGGLARLMEPVLRRQIQGRQDEAVARVRRALEA